eukprot:scaffold49683_cov37-Prasinocladus_malaysianus.AAC.3
MTDTTLPLALDGNLSVSMPQSSAVQSLRVPLTEATRSTNDAPRQTDQYSLRICLSQEGSGAIRGAVQLPSSRFDNLVKTVRGVFKYNLSQKYRRTHQSCILSVFPLCKNRGHGPGCIGFHDARQVHTGHSYVHDLAETGGWIGEFHFKRTADHKRIKRQVEACSANPHLDIELSRCRLQGDTAFIANVKIPGWLQQVASYLDCAGERDGAAGRRGGNGDQAAAVASQRDCARRLSLDRFTVAGRKRPIGSTHEAKGQIATCLYAGPHAISGEAGREMQRLLVPNFSSKRVASTAICIFIDFAASMAVRACLKVAPEVNGIVKLCGLFGELHRNINPLGAFSRAGHGVPHKVPQHSPLKGGRWAAVCTVEGVYRSVAKCRGKQALRSANRVTGRPWACGALHTTERGLWVQAKGNSQPCKNMPELIRNNRKSLLYSTAHLDSCYPA